MVSDDVDSSRATLAGVLGRAGDADDDVPGEPTSCTRRRAVKISASVNKPKGSRLLRIVPVNRVGSGIRLAQSN